MRFSVVKCDWCKKDIIKESRTTIDMSLRLYVFGDEFELERDEYSEICHSCMLKLRRFIKSLKEEQ